MLLIKACFFFNLTNKYFNVESNFECGEFKLYEVKNNPVKPYEFNRKKWPYLIT